MKCLNEASLCGEATEAPQAGHTAYGEDFYRIELKVLRLSGTPDKIPVIIPEKLFPSRYIGQGDLLEIRGEFRSKNIDSDGRRRLMLYLFAQQVDICLPGQEHHNEIELCGYLCRCPVYRRTPLGREIADLMLAVNRHYGRADYLPCVVWGRNAAFARNLREGTLLHLTGRIQSRDYIKKTESGETGMTAREISCSALSVEDE